MRADCPLERQRQACAAETMVQARASMAHSRCVPGTAEKPGGSGSGAGAHARRRYSGGGTRGICRREGGCTGGRRQVAAGRSANRGGANGAGATPGGGRPHVSLFSFLFPVLFSTSVPWSWRRRRWTITLGEQLTGLEWTARELRRKVDKRWVSCVSFVSFPVWGGGRAGAIRE